MGMQRDANNRRASWACCVSHSGRLLELVERERRLGLDEDTASAQGWACGSRRAVRWRESASRMSCIVRSEGGSRQMGTAGFVMFATSYDLENKNSEISLTERVCVMVCMADMSRDVVPV